MGKESGSGSGSSGFSGLSGNGLIAIAMLAAGALALREVPLEGTRPAANEPRVEQRFAMQDVDARLWQDPFGAIVRAREDAAKKLDATQLKHEPARHSDKALARTIADMGASGTTDITIVAVMVSGGPYAEYVESRRRTRYAVLAALNTDNYAPVDTEHLGYFLPSGNDTLPRALPEAVPFEWFEPIPGTRAAEGGKHGVLILWLDNSAFYERPFGRFQRLFNSLHQTGSTAPLLRWRVLGPVGSDGLRAMITDAQAMPDAAAPWPAGADVRFYSQAATVADPALLPAGSPPLAELMAKKGITLLRTIGNDRQLAKSLVAELELRGLRARSKPMPAGDDKARHDAYRAMCRVKAQRADSPHQIAVVAEWDTLYGRSLRREFMIDSDDDRGFCVSRFNYVRGLDGQLPERGSTPAASPGSETKQAGAAKDDNRRNDGSFIERAEGQSQFDYLRRLAARLRERDLELRATSLDGAGLRAIGVLGNDVHDKLLVLQALRPEFPNALFFTTDLDARFLHPREQPWARNLIVASNFGLRLDDGLQAGTPPFRDSYQTSTFFATRLALADSTGQQPPLTRFTQAQISPWLDTPRLFEIGRSLAFDFSAPATDLTQDGPLSCRNLKLADCPDIHPPGTPRYPNVSLTALTLLASTLILLLWLPLLALSRVLRRKLRRFLSSSRRWSPRWLRRASVAAAVLLLQLLLPLLIAHRGEAIAEWLTHEGKPISFSEGISLWPTEAIHLFTLLLCLYFVFRGWTALTRNLDRISLNLRLGKTQRQLVAEQRRLDQRLSLWRRLANMFSLRPHRDVAFTETARDSRMTPGKLGLWRHYIVQNRTVSRFARSAACMVVVMSFGGLLLYALAEPPGVPQRGAVSAHVHQTLAFAAVAVMNFLVFYVADATLFCVRFVRELRPERANWPDRTLKHFAARIGTLPPALLDHWINLQFIAQRTRCVSGLIYYPFIVISLLLLSRSQVFDNWHMPTAVTVMALLGLAIVLACAFALRQVAEKARRQALGALTESLLRARAVNAVNQPAPAHLELMRTQVDTLREGAFAPFSQQPLLKAALLPFATLGGTSLLDFMALANI